MQTNCQNCGATLTLDHYEDQLSCQYCDTVHVASLKEDADIQKLPGVASSTDCPLCFSAMHHARLERWHFLYCPDCHGLLLEAKSFLQIVQYRRRQATEPFRPPEPVDPRDLNRKIRCPDCKVPMSVHPYYGPGDFIIDSCNDCNHVWLDGGELNKTTRSRWGGALWQ